MATTKKTSSSGAYMSQYDQEVEKRLKALESQAHTSCGGSKVSDDLAAKIEELYDWYLSVKARV
jgi:ribosomal protein L37AE/L43A